MPVSWPPKSNALNLIFPMDSSSCPGRPKTQEAARNDYIKHKNERAEGRGPTWVHRRLACCHTVVFQHVQQSGLARIIKT